MTKDNNHTPQESLASEKKFPKSIDLFLKTNSIDLTLFQTIPFLLSGDNSWVLQANNKTMYRYFSINPRRYSQLRCIQCTRARKHWKGIFYWEAWKRGGRVLVRSSPDRVVRVRDLAGDIVLCSWARHLTLTVPLSTQVYKWVPANLMLGVTLRWTGIPSRGK